ncbi:MAG: FAD-dependent oxidoreductase [Verrucomicrobiota bacterium]
MKPDEPWIIVGQGLAGTCLAWQLWRRNAPFVVCDSGAGGSSRIAAGMVNPITGKNFHPGADVARCIPESVAFYRECETIPGETFWHPLPILRLASTPGEWRKISSKLHDPDVLRWLSDKQAPVVPGWEGAVVIDGGGRLDVRAFLDASRDFFIANGVYETRNCDLSSSTPRHIWCDGAAGLISGRHGPHRCAKGEMLVLDAPSWDQTMIRIGGGGWLVPLGEGLFKTGSTYDWDDLSSAPTAAGRRTIEMIATKLADENFRVISHEAGIRPILRRSDPLIGPLAENGWMFNGLGSKGSVYAPGVAHRLAHWLLDGTPPEPHYDIRRFFPGP